MEVVKCVLVRECRVYLNYLESDKTIAKHLLTEMRQLLRQKKKCKKKQKKKKNQAEMEPVFRFILSMQKSQQMIIL